MSELDGTRVLIVEDEPVVAMCLEDMLEAMGCVTVGPASRMAEGLALAMSETLDAAILDINLRGERSTSIAQALRARKVPFAFATGYGSPPEGIAEGAPLLEKPYREGQVEAVLKALLG